MKNDQGQELFVRWFGMGTFLPYVSAFLSPLVTAYLTLVKRCVSMGELVAC